MPQEKRNERRVTDEKRLNYSKTKSEKNALERSKRKEEKKQGKTQERLLAFLENIISSQGYNHKTFAEKLGTTPQSLYWIFSVKDDCDLTKVEELVRALGYTITLEFKDDPKAKNKFKQALDKTTFESNDISIRIEGEILPAISKGNNYPTPDYIKSYPENGRLHALANLFNEGGHTLREFSEITGIPSYTLRLFFSRDNIRISQIANIAKAFGLSIVWKLNRL
jgi:predicted transcriptional regulator